MAVQIDIFGNDVKPKPKKELKDYELRLYYRGNYAGTRTIKAYSRRQAIFLFYKDKYNRQYEVGNN